MLEQCIIIGFSIFYITLVISKTDALYEWYALITKCFTRTVSLVDFKLFFLKLIHCGVCSSFWLAACSSYFIGFSYIFCIAGVSSFLWIISAYLLGQMYE